MSLATGLRGRRKVAPLTRNKQKTQKNNLSRGLLRAFLRKKMGFAGAREEEIV